MKINEPTGFLIGEVRKRAYLYDTAHKYYKSQAKKAVAWEMIASQMNISTHVAKARWKNLRDCYARYKKSKMGDQGHAKKYGNWTWSAHMSFLDDPSQSRSSSDDDEIETKIEMDFENHDLIMPPSPETSPSKVTPIERGESDRMSPVSPSLISPEPPPKKQIKYEHESTTNSTAMFGKVIDFMQGERASLDRIDCLFLSYADTFKTFRPETQAKMKLKLATLFAQTELDELSYKSSNLNEFATVIC